MGGNTVPESSVLSSQGSYTDISRRTDHTSYSIPEDGRSITIQTNRRRKKDADASTTLSGTNTSLLIEYFENGKPNSGSPNRRPSVRVKVTPSAARRHHVKSSSDGLHISDVGSSPNRRPSHTQRISLSPHVGEDRLVMGDPQNNRSTSGDHSSIASYNSGADEGNYPFNVTVIREATSPGSVNSSPRELNESYNRRAARRNRSASRSKQPDGYYEKDTMKPQKGTRSRSVSREYDIQEETGLKTPKLSRRRSRSLSRERQASNRESMSQHEKQMIEQNVMEGLERLGKGRNPKSRKAQSRQGSTMNGDYLKAPRARSRSKSRDREIDDITAEKNRQQRKESQMAESQLQRSASINNPALLDLVEDAIKRLILPQLNEIKSNNHQSKLAKFNQTVASAILERQSSKKLDKSSSMPNVAKPMVVLTPDLEKGNGQGIVIAGGGGGDSQVSENNREVVSQVIAELNDVIDNGFADPMSDKSDVSYPRAPGLGLGPSRSPINSENGEGVSLVGVNSIQGATQVLEMPDAPGRQDTPGTYTGTRASILSTGSPLPYPRENGIPVTGHTPPPAPNSEFPVLSDLSLHYRDSRSNLSERNGGGGGRSLASGRSHLGVNGHDRDDGASSVSSGSRRSIGETQSHLQPGEQAPSIASLSSTQSTKLAKQRRKGKGKQSGEVGDIHEGEYWNEDISQRNGAVDAYFAKAREEAQERALMESGLGTSIEARHLNTETNFSFDPVEMEKDIDGQRVFMLGGNPSMRSTPILPNSVQASVLDVPSNLGRSDGSSRTDSRPVLGPSALPKAGDDMPEIGHMHLGEDDEELDTNPSIIQGPIGHEDWQYGTDNGHQYDDDRGLDLGSNPGGMPPSLRSLSPAIQTKDEGYISAANPGMQSPGPMTPVQQMASPSMGMGTIRGIGLEDDDYSPYRGHMRMGSGNSHGMPSPLYDSSTGRGVDRIQSKDIIALMDHLTVRDAQRNARDTEILVTLVRSAAEMRNSFEDMKKQLEVQQRNIVDEVGMNTERSVQKIIQGPRPLPPATPRAPRYPGKEVDGEDEGVAKKRNVFRRALKGLSMKSSNDLQRIEEMLCTLLTEVEGLKGGQEFYQHSLMQSQSLGTFDAFKSPGNTETAVTEAGGPANSSGANSGYYSGVPSQPSATTRIYQDERPRQSTRISPIEEDAVLRTPPRGVQGGSLPLNTSEMGVHPTAFGGDNTPTKSAEKNKRESGSSSIFPKISRWSETSASSTVRGFLRKKNHTGEFSDGSDGNFWEPPAKNIQPEPLSPYSEGHPTMSPAPPSSRGTDAPINHSNRRSLEVHAPQPRMPYNHQLEAQAQQLTASGVVPNSPGANGSTSTLGTFPPLGPGGFSKDGKLMSPLAQDAYNQHLQQQGLQPQTPVGGPPRPLKEPLTPAATDDPEYPSSEKRRSRHRDENGEKIKKHKKERTEEEKQRRREKKERREREREGGASSSASRKKSRDVISPEHEGGLGSPFSSARSPSTASRLQGPRPLSSNSNKENNRRHRHQSSQGTADTFGNGQEYEPFGSTYR